MLYNKFMLCIWKMKNANQSEANASVICARIGVNVLTSGSLMGKNVRGLRACKYIVYKPI